MTLRRIVHLLLFLVTWLTITLPAEPGPAAEIGPPAQDKRSCIQTVDGFAYLAEDKTVAELRTAAMNNAKQQALTNAKTYIRSRTEVEDFVLKSDEVLINAEGTVTILEQQDFGIIENSRYHIRIKAEVEYVIGEGSSRPIAATPSAPRVEPAITAVTAPPLPSPKAPLTVRVWSTKQVYKEGEKIEIFLQGNRDFHARVVDINDRGEIVQLLPNDFRDRSFFEGGRTYRIPDEGDRFELTVTPPFGKDRIVVYASEVPLGKIALSGIGQGLAAYGGDQQSLARATRGIAVAAKKADPTGPAVVEFFEASHDISTGK
jgi:hypothetical protein